MVLDTSVFTLCDSCRDRVPSSVNVIVPPAPLAMCWSMGEYSGFLGELIRKAKYQPSLSISDELGVWLGGCMVEKVTVDAVVPVPTTHIRRLYRGFDQADRISIGVATALGVRKERLLVRRGHSRQVGKSAEQRKRLRSNSFVFRKVRPPERVLLVDDVMTTGATLGAAARQLKAHGVSSVYAAVVANS